MTTSPSFLTAEMRDQAIGVQSNPLTLEVEKGAILKFAEAIGDNNPLWPRLSRGGYCHLWLRRISV